jgi:hypothetical protein
MTNSRWLFCIGYNQNCLFESTHKKTLTRIVATPSWDGIDRRITKIIVLYCENKFEKYLKFCENLFSIAKRLKSARLLAKSYFFIFFLHFRVT